jgi:hypothetical protein
MRYPKLLVAVFATLLFSAFTALADPILVGGTTSVTLTSAPTLTSLGLTVTGTGTATITTNSVGLPVANFPITGNNPANLIAHDGSGLLFTAGANSLSISNFLINTTTNTISGTVMVNGALVGNGIPLFNIGPNLTLTLSSQALNAFGATFSLPPNVATALSTAEIGRATITPVPEPGTIALLLTGAPLVGAALRRRFQKNKAASDL